MILCLLALGLPCLILVLFVFEVGLSLSKLGRLDLDAPTQPETKSTVKKK